MTGRERLNAVLRGEPVDRPAWTTLVDGATLSIAPEELRGNGGLDFYRHLGCDIFLLDGWGTPHAFRSPDLRWGEGVAVRSWAEGADCVTTVQTGRGELRTVTRRGHPVRYPVTTLEEVRLYRELWEGARFVGHDDTPVLAALDALIGDDGCVARFWGPSTIPRLLECDMGSEAFYYLLHDHREEMEGLIDAIHQRELEAFRLLAEGPCDVVILCENTSTYYISPEVYRRYNGPHVRDFVEIVKAAGKTALVHMCGHVRALLQEFRWTGMEGIHALTPPPTGDTPWELALDVLGEETILFGVLDPTIFCLGPVEQIGPTLDALYTPRLRRSRLVLWAAADGIAVPLERFLAIKAWVEKQAG